MKLDQESSTFARHRNGCQIPLKKTRKLIFKHMRDLISTIAEVKEVLYLEEKKTSQAAQHNLTLKIKP
jgi:hypothetical protein